VHDFLSCLDTVRSWAREVSAAYCPLAITVTKILYFCHFNSYITAIEYEQRCHNGEWPTPTRTRVITLANDGAISSHAISGIT
jgi:hypothetical protein